MHEIHDLKVFSWIHAPIRDGIHELIHGLIHALIHALIHDLIHVLTMISRIRGVTILD